MYNIPADFFNRSHSRPKTPQNFNIKSVTELVKAQNLTLKEEKENENIKNNTKIKNSNKFCQYKDSKFFFITKNSNENSQISQKKIFKNVRDPYNFSSTAAPTAKNSFVNVKINNYRSTKKRASSRQAYKPVEADFRKKNKEKYNNEIPMPK